MLEIAAQIWPLFVIILFALLAIRHNRRVPNWGEVPVDLRLDQEPDGALIVPVSQILHRRTFGFTRNGISPKLWLVPGGLRFKVFGTSERRFADFERVHATRTLLRSTVLIFFGHGERVHFMLPSEGVAHAVLRALPADLPLSAAAAALLGDRVRK